MFKGHLENPPPVLGTQDAKTDLVLGTRMHTEPVVPALGPWQVAAEGSWAPTDMGSPPASKIMDVKSLGRGEPPQIHLVSLRGNWAPWGLSQGLQGSPRRGPEPTSLLPASSVCPVGLKGKVFW